MTMHADASPFEKVIAGGYCVGCGACKFHAPTAITIEANREGFLQARIAAPEAVDLAKLGQLCPMSGQSLDEDDLAGELFPDAPRHDQIGRLLSVAAVHVNDDGRRLAASSGGLLTWLATELLDRGIVDAIVHVGTNDNAERDDLFGYRISVSSAEVRNHTKSRYYPVELSGALSAIKASGRSVAVLGVPCFIKAVRLAAKDDPDLSRRVKFCLGLICGHLKSRHFAEFLAWQAGIEPDDLGYFDFRHKLQDKPASEYGFRAVSRSTQREVVKPMSEVFGGDWGLGLFKYRACDFCDDVTAECADIAVGDAWLPRYIEDFRGKNIAVFRHPLLRSIVDEGVQSGSLSLDELTAGDLRQSQAAGLRHRNEGLAHRLQRAKFQQIWVPRKRVEPADAVDPKRGRIYEIRSELQQIGSDAYIAAREAKDLRIFFRTIRPLIRNYRRHYLPPLPVRAIRKIIRIGRRIASGRR